MAPATRLSLGLASLAATILLLADIFGLIPDAVGERMQSRKHFAESLAVQLSVSAGRSDFGTVQATMKEVVDRENQLVSIGLRRADGRLISHFGPHEREWTQDQEEGSTATQIQVPIYQRDQYWGAIELRFIPLSGSTLGERFVRSGLALIPFFVVAAFFAFRYVHRRALAVLDPQSVVPDRVKAAFDTLTEGVLILDAKERIILANAPFADKFDVTIADILGKPASSFAWATGDDQRELPWMLTLRDGLQQSTIPLRYQPPDEEPVTFIINCGAIRDEKGKSRGALVTFDDVSAMEQKNTELQKTIKQLAASEEEIRKQNHELERLATRDPLTGSFNRRTFFERFEALFAHALRHNEPLCCIMTDIDHFKSVNDRYGHAVGDKVIKIVAEVLEVTTRGEDIVGRYGGEEFCVILPGLDRQEATAVAERLRTEIYESSASRFTSGLRFTASLGLSEINSTTPDPAELVNQADQALYKAKQTGRNKVVFWEIEEVVEESDADSAGSAEQQSAAAPGSDEETRALRAQIHELELRLEDSDRELRQQYGKDSLTGLPNRILFHDRITQAIARSKRNNKLVAVLSVDLEQFSQVNEAVGEQGGNVLLKLVAARLTSVLRDEDTVAVLSNKSTTVTISRIANDEFGISIADIPNNDTIPRIVERIINELKKPAEIEGVEIYPNACLGVSVFPQDSDSAEVLLKNASSARREAKRTEAPSRWIFYDQNFNRKALGRLQQESRLRQALESGQFEIHYQPRMAAKSGRILSGEALIRLRDSGKILMPGDFIPLAEEAGLIHSIGEWLANTACKQLSWWDLEHDGIDVAINVSAVELKQGDIFYDRILRTIGTSGIAPEHLELEITESVLMDRASEGITALRRLRELGVKVSIDDFGTGFSSISQLRDLPVTAVKIDRSFVNDLGQERDSRGLITGIITMAQSLGLTVVAEGVETHEQWLALKELGCDEVQGYFFSKPVSTDEFTSMLSTGGSWEVMESASIMGWQKRIGLRLQKA